MNIYESILSIMGGVGAIGKGKKNAQQGFMYRGVDDVMNALQPLLVENKVFVVPEILEQIRESRQTNKGGTLIYSVLTMKYTFFAEDGSNVSAIVVGEGMDTGDKASNKAMSVAYKYACFQVFSIPTEEMKDPDADTPPPSEPVIETFPCVVCGKPVAKDFAEKSVTANGKVYCSGTCRDKDKVGAA